MKDELYSYNYVRNRNKLFTNLISMIDGITCDGEITEQELLYLDTWILEAKELQNNVIFQQIRDQIIDIQKNLTFIYFLVYVRGLFLITVYQTMKCIT